MYNYMYVIIMYYDIVDETSDSNKGEETTCREVYIPPPPPDDELFIISPTRELTLQIYNEARSLYITHYIVLLLSMEELV